MNTAEHRERQSGTAPRAGHEAAGGGGTPIPAGAVVVGLDRSAQSAAALEWAAAEADSRGLPVHLIHAMQPPLWPDPTRALECDDAPAGCVVDARRALADSHPGLSVSWSQPYGAALPALASASRFATLVVVGTRARGAVRQAMSGSTAVELIAEAHCPTVVIHAPLSESNLSGPVVVGLAGRDTDGDALDAAFREAGAHERSVVVVHGSDYGILESTRIERLVEDVHVHYPQVRVSVHVQRGEPADLLVTRSRNASLLVIGSHGRHETAAMVLGSVGQTLLRQSACPVLIARRGTLRPVATAPAPDEADGDGA